MAITADYYVDFDSGNDSNAGTSTGAPWLTLQKAADTVVAGDVVACKGTDTLAASVDFDINAGTLTNNIRFIGVNSSWDEDGTRAIVDGDSTATNCITRLKRHFQFRNFDFQNSTSDAISSNTEWVFINCKFSNPGGYAVASSSGDTFLQCHLLNPTSRGVNGPCSMSKSIIVNTGIGILGSSVQIMDSIVHSTTSRAVGISGSLGVVVGCTLDAGVNGILLQNEMYTASNNRITNMTGTGINNSSSYGNSIVENNYFYNPSGTDINSVNTVFEADSNRYTSDNSGTGYADQPNDDFTLTSTGDGVGVSNPVGGTNETTNIVYATQGMTPAYPAATAPTFAGITKFEILSNNKFYVEWAAATGTTTAYRIYIKNATNPFTETALCVDDTVTGAIISTLGDAVTFPTAGTTYYCGVRAENAGSEDTNVVELSNICSGSETIQRMTNTVVSV